MDKGIVAKAIIEKEDVIKIANNALYFADNSDYATALWKILEILKPELFKPDSTPLLKYIED